MAHLENTRTFEEYGTTTVKGIGLTQTHGLISDSDHLVGKFPTKIPGP